MPGIDMRQGAHDVGRWIEGEHAVAVPPGDTSPRGLEDDVGNPWGRPPQRGVYPFRDPSVFFLTNDDPRPVFRPRKGSIFGADQGDRGGIADQACAEGG